jgi:hypothetical protein
MAVLEEDRARLGRVFARHAYGMRRWVDLFSLRVPATDDPGAKELLAELVADNARHMNLFRARAQAHGVDPDAYRAPPEGEVIYERIDELRDLPELAGYAAGSLDHFTQLLDAYAETASGEDARVIAAVRADVERMRERLAPLAAGAGESEAAAHELYRRRELVETGWYADDR